MLQSTYCNDQIGPFENLHQLVENAPLVILRARLEVFFQYSLRFANCLKRQLLINHCFFPIKKWLRNKADREIKSALRLSHQILFRDWSLYFAIASPFRPKMWARCPILVRARGHDPEWRRPRIVAKVTEAGF